MSDFVLPPTTHSPRSLRRLLPLLVTAALLLFTGCSTDGGPVVDGAWARPTPPDADRTAIYAVITNDGSAGDRLVAASSARCTTAELHVTVTDSEGVARMRPAEDAALVIESGDALALEPGGLHVMCMGVTEPLAAGDEFPVTFEFDSGTTVEVDVVAEQR